MTSHKDMLRLRDEIFMGSNAIERYLNYIGIQVLRTTPEIYENMSFMLSREYGYRFTYMCRCELKDWKYFEKIARFIENQKIVKVNEDNLKYATHSSLLDSFSIYEYDEYVIFEIQMTASEKEQVDEYVMYLKEHTKDLVYRKYSEDFDNQVEDELGE